jgi:zinc transporter
MLPVTLITGIFGMNVGGLPLLHSAGGCWLVMMLMAGTAVVTRLLRWRGLF